jgi:hypothetical protein
MLKPPSQNKKAKAESSVCRDEYIYQTLLSLKLSHHLTPGMGKLIYTSLSVKTMEPT